jgi:DNA-binding response OmpR family regulator
MSDRPRVLVCDDEPQILRALRITLRDDGFDVIPAATAAEALDAAALRALDAAILDLVLPDGDGIEVTRRLREWSAMPIIVLSAVGEEDQKVRALEAGADDYVTKPFSPRELVARLHAVLRRSRSSGDEPVLRAGEIEHLHGGAQRPARPRAADGACGEPARARAARSRRAARRQTPGFRVGRGSGTGKVLAGATDLPEAP